MSVLDDFQEWKDFLHERVDMAQDLGIDEESINSFSYQIGDYLSKHVEPRNAQERVLKDLWTVADKDEKHALAKLMVKLVK